MIIFLIFKKILLILFNWREKHLILKIEKSFKKVINQEIFINEKCSDNI